jgi:16S rRNA (cytidine1402-2'-O)-methyltransferase
VNECVKNNIKIIPIPGPSAVATAVSISGFSEKFIFYGFLPEKKQAIANVFNQISKFNEHMCFFCIFKKSE